MAKYFYVYHVNDGTTDCIVKMFNTDSVVNGKRGLISLRKRLHPVICRVLPVASRRQVFQLNQELANADTAEQEAKRILAAKMADYHAARDAYAEAADNLKKVNAKFGIV